MFFMVAKRVSLRTIFRAGNNQKSLGARSGEYGGWVMTRTLFSARNCCTTIDVWLGASHRATHRLLSSSSSPRKAFLSSPNHRTLRISLRVTFGCSLLWKWSSRGRVSQPWKISNGMRLPNSRRFQKKPFAGASNNGRIVGASVCARARVLLWSWLGKRCHMSYHYSATPHFRELFDCPS